MGGGVRTIGLLPTLYRIWARLREGAVREWEHRFNRHYFSFGAGKSAPNAIFRMLVDAEAALAKGDEAAAPFLDLEKFYENVGHAVVMRAACATGFPVTVVKLAVAMYGAQRRLTREGCASKAVSCWKGIIAGCSHATAVVKLIMVGPLDRFLADIMQKKEEKRIYLSSKNRSNPRAVGQ